METASLPVSIYNLPIPTAKTAGFAVLARYDDREVEELI
jgi:hypothetical protein